MKSNESMCIIISIFLICTIYLDKQPKSQVTWNLWCFGQDIILSRNIVVYHPTTCYPSMETNFDYCQFFSLTEFSSRWSPSWLNNQNHQQDECLDFLCPWWLLNQLLTVMIIFMWNCHHQLSVFIFLDLLFDWLQWSCTHWKNQSD